MFLSLRTSFGSIVQMRFPHPLGRLVQFLLSLRSFGSIVQMFNPVSTSS